MTARKIGEFKNFGKPNHNRVVGLLLDSGFIVKFIENENTGMEKNGKTVVVPYNPSGGAHSVAKRGIASWSGRAWRLWLEECKLKLVATPLGDRLVDRD